MSRYAPGCSSSDTRSSRAIDELAQTAASTRSYASLMMVLPRSKRNQVVDMAIGCRCSVVDDGQPSTEHYILNTPNFGSPILALYAMERPRPRYARVSAGSMTPSSQRRAVE